MVAYFDFGHRHIVSNDNKKLNNSNSSNNYIILILNLFKLFLGIFFIVSSISGFMGFIRLINLYKQRNAQLIDFYIEIIKKKNEFNYVSSKAYKEVRLRKLYGAYKKSEKLVVFTDSIKVEQQSVKNRQIKPAKLWRNLLTRGVLSITD